MGKTLIIMALESEAPDLAQRSDVIISGLGKINAAVATTRAISDHSPDLIINIGTAGGITVGQGLHEARRFVQRDMLCQPLGFAPGETPFDSSDSMIEFGTGLICSTGDNFVTNGNELTLLCDLVDMEAYAVAKVCKKFKINFRCYKWVTDSADKESASKWQQAVNHGQRAFLEILSQHGF